MASDCASFHLPGVLLISLGRSHGLSNADFLPRSVCRANHARTADGAFPCSFLGSLSGPSGGLVLLALCRDSQPVFPLAPARFAFSRPTPSLSMPPSHASVQPFHSRMGKGSSSRFGVYGPALFSTERPRFAGWELGGTGLPSGIPLVILVLYIRGSRAQPPAALMLPPTILPNPPSESVRTPTQSDSKLS